MQLPWLSSSMVYRRLNREHPLLFSTVFGTPSPFKLESDYFRQTEIGALLMGHGDLEPLTLYHNLERGFHVHFHQADMCMFFPDLAGLFEVSLEPPFGQSPK